MPYRLEGVLAAMDVDTLRQRADEMLTDMGAGDAGEPRQLADHYIAHIEGIAQAMRDVCPDGDVYELPQAMASAWLELKMIWNRCNQQMQYQNMQDGASPGLMVAGSLIGQLLENMRQFLDVDSLMLVDRIGSDLYETARHAGEQNGRLLDRMSNASDGANRAVEALLMALDQVQQQLQAPETRRELDKAVEVVVEEIGRALVLTGEDIGAALEARLLKTLDGAPLRVLPQLQGFDSRIEMPPDVARLLANLCDEWALALKRTALNRSVAQRLAAQQPAFVTLKVCLGMDAHDVVLTLIDDGDGTVDFTHLQSSDAVHNLRLDVVQTEGQGSRLEARCSMRKVVDYLVVRSLDDSIDGWLAVPLSAVESIEQRSADHLRMRGSVLTGREGGDAIPVVDTGLLLFNEHNVRHAQDAYVIVRPECGRRMALRVQGIEGTRRASLHAVPQGLRATRMRGFIQSEQKVIGVLDLGELSRLQLDACAA